MTKSSVEMSQRTVFAVTWIPVLTFGAILTIPAFVGVLGKHYGMSEAALGRLASVEFLACIIGTYLSNNRSVLELARWMPWTCSLTIVANVAGAFLVSHVPLIYFHPLGAFGAGITYGYLLKVIDVSGKQERYFGMFMALFNLTMLGEFQTITYLTNNYTPATVFIIYAALACAALIISLATRRSLKDVISPKPEHVESPRRRSPAIRILVSIFAIGISYTAYGMIWPFAQIMGVTRGFSTVHVANGLSAYAVTAILGGLAGAVLSPKINRAVVFSAALCALLGSIYMMSLGASYLLFFIGCAIFGFYWNFYLTLQIGLVSRADDTGRGIVLCGVAPSIGVIIGSFMGGMLVHGSTFFPLAQAGAVLCVTGIACTIASMTRMKANDASNPAPHAAS